MQKTLVTVSSLFCLRNELKAAEQGGPAGVSGVGVTVGALAIIGSAAGFIKFTLSEPIEQENELQLARDKAYSLHV